MRAGLPLFSLILVVAMSSFFPAGCNSEKSLKAETGVAGGDPRRGQAALNRYACATCHTIAGFHSSGPLIGPPLDRAAAVRPFLIGTVPNNAENLVRWIEDPQSVDPQSSMPNLGVTPEDARDIAAYLYSLR
jgi:cytochrome c